MTFARPDLLPLAPLVALGLALAIAAQWRRLRRLAEAYGEVAAARLVPARLDRFPGGRLLCLTLAGLAIGLAAAGPAPTEPAGNQEASPLDVAIAVDVSLSMGAADTDPSRIARARNVVARITDELPSARIVLVVFAGWPYTLVPPTDDPAVVRYFAGSLAADLLADRDQGTSLAATIAHAQGALDGRSRPGARRAILLLSDGDVHDDDGEVIRAVSGVSEAGVQIWTAGLGTARGAELTGAAGPIVDARGGPVRATLNDQLLRSVAAAGGGRYEDVTEDRGLESLVGALRQLSGDSDEEAGGPIDAAFWLTFLSIPLLLWEGVLDAGKGAISRGKSRVGR